MCHDLTRDTLPNILYDTCIMWQVEGKIGQTAHRRHIQ